MKKIEITDANRHEIIAVLKGVDFFKSLKQSHLIVLLKYGEARQYGDGDVVMRQGSAVDGFLIILEGKVDIYAERAEGDRKKLATLDRGNMVGEIGVLLKKPASVTAVANGTLRALKFTHELFFNMFEKVPNFGLALARNLATRLEGTSGQISLPKFQDKGRKFERRVTDLLPVPFITRHRVLPVRLNGNQLTLGFVDEPSPGVLDSVYQQLPGMEILPVRIQADYFNGVLQSRIGVDSWTKTSKPGGRSRTQPKVQPKLEALLKRMVAEGASDLHLAEGEQPRWRLDGDLHLIEDAAALDLGELEGLFEPVLESRHKLELKEQCDTDFGYALEDMARFRINLFYDAHGTSASIRQIPSNIMNVDHLGAADQIKRLCAQPNGLVLVTGPTGSGKSTTLAAMIDSINQRFSRHVITLEDPIEFVYQTNRCVINQREVGGHTPSFQRGLRSVMREDPDVVLVGEILDLETLGLVLETASTGHLVFSTLHTRSAASTVDRIIDMYPTSQHIHIRSSLSDILRGVISQTLCKRVGGGRIAGMEVMMVTRAVANLIREGKAVQIPNIMQAAKKDGHLLLNDHLAQLVTQGKVEFEEALLKTVDPSDLATRLKKPLPDHF